ncbi:hypothetical protein FJ875_25900 [Salmonella enterica]|nr:hypothetical protein [Salmonella enterica]
MLGKNRPNRRYSGLIAIMHRAWGILRPYVTSTALTCLSVLLTHRAIAAVPDKGTWGYGNGAAAPIQIRVAYIIAPMDATKNISAGWVRLRGRGQYVTGKSDRLLGITASGESGGWASWDCTTSLATDCTPKGINGALSNAQACSGPFTDKLRHTNLYGRTSGTIEYTDTAEIIERVKSLAKDTGYYKYLGGSHYTPNTDNYSLGKQTASISLPDGIYYTFIGLNEKNVTAFVCMYDASLQ